MVDTFYKSFIKSVPYYVLLFKKKYNLAITDSRFRDATKEEILLDFFMDLVCEDYPRVEELEKYMPDEAKSLLKIKYGEGDDDDLQKAHTAHMDEAGVLDDIRKLLMQEQG